MFTMVVDNFLSESVLDELISYIEKASFGWLKNEVDGVQYPLICDKIPENIYSHIINAINKKVGFKPARPFMFMRMSPKGVPVSNIAHTDNSMGRFSLMLYLNKDKDAKGGTALLEHIETGAKRITDDLELLEKVKRDSNNIEAWKVHKLFDMKKNRAAIFDSHYFHRAEPLGGFGENKENSRVVLTVFFS